MNTTVNTNTRRTSIAGYNAILSTRNEREAKELAAQEAIKQKTIEEMLAASQGNINVLCKDIEDSYGSMVKDGHEMKQCQDELSEKLKEEELFHATASEVYPFPEVDESLEHKMSLRRFAYYALPALDCFFAWFALYPIVTSKIADLSSAISGLAVVIGAALSIAVGLGVSLISRLGVSSLEDANNTDSMKGLKKVAIAGAVISLPLMYIIGEVAFNGGTQWTYSGCFAFISLIIQLLIVTGYKRQMEALEYFRKKIKLDGIKHIKESDERAIGQEIATLRGKIQSILVAFEQHYATFSDKFRSLAAARDEHILQFGKDANYYLNQMVIYIGDLVCFRREAIPLYYESNGTVSTIPFVDFPYVAGGRNIFMNNDFIYLDYMMQRSQTGIPLSETLRIVEEQQNRGLNPHIAQQENQTAPEPQLDTPSAEDNPDDDQDGGGIW